MHSTLLRYLLLAGLLLSQVSLAAPERLASLDWTLGETLVALEAPPAAMAQIADYHSWVGEPAMPEQVVDLGLRTQPNLELLASLKPDGILISPMFANQRPVLERIAPVTQLELYSPGADTWAEMLELTRKLGALTERQQAAERLIETTQVELEQLRTRLPEQPPAVLIIQFMDARHVRVFGANGLYQVALDKLGLVNAWPGGTNSWGFALVGIDALVGLDAQLVVIDPKPAGVERELQRSALWQRLPGVNEGRVLTLPPTWSFGALPSLQRFATLLVAALETQRD
ncbi:ABC transporter substrate-binding protein [Pseudomonas sp. WN033]|nr:ABC transporter substrate-binding protein [Pseudomonas sp. WN033]